MKLGLHVGYWGLGMSAEDQLDLVKEAERLGFDSVWAAEAYGSDAATVLAWLAAGTERINLGSAIFQIAARTPAMTAMTAATLDHLSKGRFRLGLGASGPQVVEGWHGQPFKQQLSRTKEYIEIVRKAFTRERLTYEGDLYQLPLPGGPGKALKLTIDTVQDQIPIYLAAIGPKNTALAAEIANGWIPAFFAPDHMDAFKDSLDEGRSRRSSELGELDIAPMVQMRIDDDPDRARDFMRPALALYVGGMGSRKRNFYVELVSRYGFESAARQVQELYLEGKKTEAMAHLPADLIDMTTLCGPKDRVSERLRVFREAQVGTLMVTPVAATAGDRADQLRMLAGLV